MPEPAIDLQAAERLPFVRVVELQKQYGDQGFTVLGVPCNQFKGQEPGTAEEIQTFCSTTYGVTFPLLEKTDVNGPSQHPLYAELTQHADAEGTAGELVAPPGDLLLEPVAGRIPGLARREAQCQEPSRGIGGGVQLGAQPAARALRGLLHA